MTATYPASLPLPLQSGYSEDYAPAVLRTQFLDGTARQRVHPNNAADASVKITLQFTDSEYQIFYNFYLNTINSGCDWFIMNLPDSTGAISARTIRIQSGKFSKSLIFRNSEMWYWKVSFTADLRSENYGSANT